MTTPRTPMTDPRAAAVESALSCPPPGADPDALRRAAATLAGLGSDLDGALGAVRADQGACLWRGAAGDAFRHLLDDAPRHLDEVGTRYRAYALALYAHATGMDDLRLRFRLAQNTLRTARDDAARAAAAGAGTVAGTFGPPGTDRIDPALRALDALRDEALTHARRCSNALHHITDHDHLHNPHGWHHALDSTSAALGRLGATAGLAAIAAMILCPELAPLLLALAAASSAAEGGADVARRASGEDVSWTDLGLDALGAVPAAGIAGEAVAGARLAVGGVRAASSADRGVEAVFDGIAWAREGAVGAVRGSVADIPTGVRRALDPSVWRTARRTVTDLPAIGRNVVEAGAHHKWDVVCSIDTALGDPVARAVVGRRGPLRLVLPRRDEPAHPR